MSPSTTLFPTPEGRKLVSGSLEQGGDGFDDEIPSRAFGQSLVGEVDLLLEDRVNFLPQGLNEFAHLRGRINGVIFCIILVFFVSFFSPRLS